MGFVMKLLCQSWMSLYAIADERRTFNEHNHFIKITPWLPGKEEWSVFVEIKQFFDAAQKFRCKYFIYLQIEK